MALRGALTPRARGTCDNASARSGDRDDDRRSGSGVVDRFDSIARRRLAHGMHAAALGMAMFPYRFMRRRDATPVHTPRGPWRLRESQDARRRRRVGCTWVRCSSCIARIGRLFSRAGGDLDRSGSEPSQRLAAPRSAACAWLWQRSQSRCCFGARAVRRPHLRASDRGAVLQATLWPGLARPFDGHFRRSRNSALVRKPVASDGRSIARRDHVAEHLQPYTPLVTDHGRKPLTRIRTCIYAHLFICLCLHDTR